VTATLSRTDRPQAPTAAAPTPRSRPELVALAVLLAGTAALYLVDLGASGYANSYYAAAVQAMTRSWEAFLFGSLDAGNVITVDKPPASLWVMAASARIFGFSSWSMLAPQALLGVGSVALLYAAVRRVAGWRPALLAGAVLALTPVAALMFRFNNPDALLELLTVAAAYATVRAIERAGTRWLLLAGVFIGFAFLAKMAQGLVVLPALALAYLVAAPTGAWRRVRQLLAAGAALVLSAGWYLALVELWPAGSRPYIGGSQGDSIVELALGYNGLARILGGWGGPGPGGGPGAADAAAAATGGPPSGLPFGPGGAGGFGGEAGLTRMFNSEIGDQVAWLLPAALALLVVGLWLVRGRPRTDPVRASLLLWGGWTVVTALVFSLAAGVFHAYYTVALAPGIAALIGIGGHLLWRHRASWPARSTLAALVVGTAAVAWVLLGRTPEFLPWLRWVIAGAAAVTALALLVRPGGRHWAATVALAAVLTGLAGPTAYAVQTAATPHTGSIPLAGPASDAGAARFGPGPWSGSGSPGATAAAGGLPGGGTPSGGMPGGGMPAGGPGAAETLDPALVTLLQGAGTRWSAATVSAMSGASLALGSDTTVMSIGGFTGSDPAPTLQQFQEYVTAGQVRYFVEGGGPFGRAGRAGADAPGPGPGGMPGGRSGTGSEITTWVQQTFTSTSVGDRTVYDLTRPQR
jgi:4-amino-4-deoxy-L-arabinose transferase-like glycosyltransferase